MKSFLTCCLLLGFSSAIHGQTARWADPGLPVKSGLELWLDATRENEAREAHYMNRLSDGESSDMWHDSSGHGRHLEQWTETARPVWISGAFNFDGDDYFAGLLTPGVSLKDSTVVVVASVTTPQGGFPGLLSTARRGENDYTSGITVDFGREAAPEGFVNYLNVEGAGQLRERNTMTSPVSSKRGHVYSISLGKGQSSVRIDGKNQGKRDRGDVAFAIDRVAIGARFVNPEMRHYLKGRIAEILVFDRDLGGQELESIEQFLMKKHATFLTQPPPEPEKSVENLPIVQMLVPGFEVYELPISTTNLNNIEYASDGRLFAGGYDGRFHLFRDKDGDGLEEEITTFENNTSDNYPIGMVVKDGSLHALLSDEIVRFRDTDRDGIPDRRETVFKNWDDPELSHNPLLQHRRVDGAMALAAGPNDDWYLTMGSANPGNGYWQQSNDANPFAIDANKTGKPEYSPDKLRGCVLHIDKNGKVERLNSGLRYIMSLQWNRFGDLFGTDQEGATWLPNGNPFDELLHLQSGRHYGFPPRHPSLLPHVVDEPSLWDYTPQHQSTCGFRFNGPAKDRPRFGPDFWAHDAIVTGESRGKLWRTSLSKTSAGYVAANQLFASVGMLIIDCAISPKGELVICCHSGPPDWGAGPAGKGRLFKIRHTNKILAEPVRAWAKSETETVIDFDRPLPISEWDELETKVTVEGGHYVGAGDRFELLRPGYAVVREQQGTPRFKVAVQGIRAGKDGRSMVITTEPRRHAVPYAVSIGAPRKEAGIMQVGSIDLGFNLAGVKAEWIGQGASWEGALPHLDPGVIADLGRGSSTCTEALKHMGEPGKLTLKTRLDLSHMLQPRVQPGSKLDYTPEMEKVTVTLKSDSVLSVKRAGLVSQGKKVSFTAEQDPTKAWEDLEIELTTPAKNLEITFHTAIDHRERPLGVNRFLMPFAVPPLAAASSHALPPQIAGGDSKRGKELFFGKAACFTCHQMRGEGSPVGPDLSNSFHRDYDSLMRDIIEPSATINPDAVAYSLTLASGTSVVGTRVGETAEELKIAAPGGAVTAVKKSEIVKSDALSVSLMPSGLLSSLSESEIKDLMTYMLTPPAGDN